MGHRCLPLYRSFKAKMDDTFRMYPAAAMEIMASTRPDHLWSGNLAPSLRCAALQPSGKRRRCSPLRSIFFLTYGQMLLTGWWVLSYQLRCSTEHHTQQLSGPTMALSVVIGPMSFPRRSVPSEERTGKENARVYLLSAQMTLSLSARRHSHV